MTLKVFDRKKKKIFKDAILRIGTLSLIKNCRESVKAEIRRLRDVAEAADIFISDDMKERFWNRTERDLWK